MKVPVARIAILLAIYVASIAVPPATRAVSPSYSATVLADSPVSYWRLGENSGTVAADSAGANTASIKSGVTLGTAGAIANDANTAMTFNGTTGYVTAANAANLNFSGDFSIEAWAKPSVLTGAAQGVLHKGGTSNASTWQYRLSVAAGGQWRGSVYVGSSTISVTSAVTASLTAWSHLVLTRAGTRLTLYVNGAAVATTTFNGNVNAGSGTLALGRTGSKSADYFHGAIDEAAVYASALSAAAVSAHYSAGTTPPPAPVAAFSGSPTSGTAPLAVTFTDQSTGPPAAWSWDFGDGTSSTAQNPVHTYAAAGSYSVSLTVTNSGGSNSLTKPSYIGVATPPPPTSYAMVVASDSPASYWRLGETSGSTAADAAGSSPGSINGGVTLGVPGALAGDANTAMGFNGSTGYVSVPDAASLDFAGDFTVEAWAKPNALTGIGGAVVHKGGSSGYPVWQYRMSITGGNQWRGTVFVGNSNIAVTAPGVASTTSWTHLAMTKAGSTLTLYVNGAAVATTTVSGIVNTSTGILAIGRTGASSSDYFNGQIDEVAVYPTALSAARIAAHHTAGVTPPG